MKYSVKKITALTVAAFAIIAAAVWLYIENTIPVVRNITVPLPGINTTDNNFTVVVLSDTHFSAGDGSRMMEIADAVNKLKPDMVLMLGDFISGSPDRSRSVSMDELSRFVSAIKAEYGIYFVTGNHELWYGKKLVEDALKKGGATLLTGKTKLLTLPGKSKIQLAGVPDFSTDNISPQPEILPEFPTIVLMHDANAARFLTGKNCFSVAGHTHGGQIRLLPGEDNRLQLRNIVVKIKHKLGILHIQDPPLVLFDRGFTSFRKQKIFITSGLGASNFALRIFCPPEIVKMKLVSSGSITDNNRYHIPEEF